MTPHATKRPALVLAVFATAIALVAAACSQAPTTAAPSGQPQATTETVQTVVQSAQLQPAPAGAQPSGWETTEALRGQLTLLAKFDSSGPAAWDPAKHPNVFISSMSYPVKRDEGKIYGNGFYIIDSSTKEVVTSRVYDLGEEVTSYPHAAGTSPDGQWIYFMSADRPAATKVQRNLIMIVNAKTLKLDKVLTHPTQRLHHVGAFKDYAGNDRVIINLGFGANGGPHFLLDPKNDNKVVQAITFDNVRPMGHPYTIPSPDGKFLYISMGAPEIREADAYAANIAKWDIEKKTATIIHGVGNHPIGITNTVDGKFTYVVDGTNSIVFKIDNKENKVVAKTSAGVAGPYGARLNWDETLLFTVGKGEGTHNRGGVLGVIDTKTFSAARVLPQMPINLVKPGDETVVVASVDHAVLHPDPAVNELWVTNMAGNNVIVMDLKTYQVKKWIMTPNGGNTHGGSFVKYDASFKGELLYDMFGPSTPIAKLIAEKVAQVK